MSDLTEALKMGARAIYRDQHKWWREILTGLDAEALNWRPGRPHPPALGNNSALN